MFRPVPIKLKRGEAVFHHPLAVHGSLENKYRAIVLMAMVSMAMAIIMAMIMVSMEVLQKSTGQWCPCRCGEGNDIDIGVLHSAEQVQVNAYMDIDIDSAGRTSEICCFLFKPSNLRSERWRRAAVMNFMADGTRLEMFCTSLVYHIWREIGKFLPLT